MNHYILYSIIFLALSFFTYKLLLKKEMTFQFNRFFLMFTLLLSISAPLVEIESDFAIDNELYKPLNSNNEVNAQFETSHLNGESIQIITKKPNTLFQILLFAYVLVTAILLIRFFKNIFSLYLLIQKSEKIKNELTLVLTEKVGIFSFFNYFFINKNNYAKSEISEIIFKHEAIHAKQLHSVDILVVEFLKCIFWFNPFMWLYKNEISENHEYIADNLTLKKGVDRTDYANILIHQTKITSTNALSCGFSFIHTKNRIKMMNQMKSKTVKVGFKILIAFLLIGGAFVLNSFTPKNSKTTTVIINAGHGGKDVGLAVNGILEKDITLKLLHIIEDICKNDPSVNIKVVRSEDEFISLADRITKINELKGDLMIDLHLDQVENETIKGIALVYSENNIHPSNSSIFASAIAMSLVNNENDAIKIRTANYSLLKEVNCPAITLQLGFLTNEEDRQSLQSDEYLTELAVKIKNGILSAQSMIDESK